MAKDEYEAKQSHYKGREEKKMKDHTHYGVIPLALFALFTVSNFDKFDFRLNRSRSSSLLRDGNLHIRVSDEYYWKDRYGYVYPTDFEIKLKIRFYGSIEAKEKYEFLGELVEGHPIRFR